MTFKEICKNEEINAYLKKGDENLGQLGYTDHSQAHCVQVARQAGKILERFGYSDHEIEPDICMISAMPSIAPIMRSTGPFWQILY